MFLSLIFKANLNRGAQHRLNSFAKRSASSKNSPLRKTRRFSHSKRASKAWSRPSSTSKKLTNIFPKKTHISARKMTKSNSHSITSKTLFRAFENKPINSYNKTPSSRTGSTTVDCRTNSYDSKWTTSMRQFSNTSSVMAS